VIRHVSVLTFVDGTTDAQVREICAALATLPARIPALRAYNFGPDLAVDSGNGSFAVVAEFDDADGYRSYRDDPEHQRIIAELIRPILAGRAAVQQELPAP
jgi:hypothetical protein